MDCEVTQVPNCRKDWANKLICLTYQKWLRLCNKEAWRYPNQKTDFRLSKVNQFSTYFAGEDAKYSRPRWTFILGCIEKVLLILNASANFLYYCFAGREFRRQFYQTLVCLCGRKLDLNSSPPTRNMSRVSRRTKSEPTDHTNLRKVSIKCTFQDEVSWI